MLSIETSIYGYSVVKLLRNANGGRFYQILFSGSLDDCIEHLRQLKECEKHDCQSKDNIWQCYVDIYGVWHCRENMVEKEIEKSKSK